MRTVLEPPRATVYADAYSMRITLAETGAFWQSSLPPF